MRPPMNDKVTVNLPTGETDRFGKAVTFPLETNARVSFVSKTVTNADGQRQQSSAEIDLPPHVVVPYGATITFTQPDGNQSTMNVLQVDSATTLANNILYWTVNLGT